MFLEIQNQNFTSYGHPIVRGTVHKDKGAVLGDLVLMCRSFNNIFRWSDLFGENILLLLACIFIV